MTGDLQSAAAGELRLLERRLVAHVARMDARVDHLLLRPAAPTDDEITEIDVLCASIGEVQELLLATRRRSL